jgi:hypothetical protein
VTPPNHKRRKIIKTNAIAHAQLIKAMLDGTLTCQELAEHTGLHYVTVLQYTRELHAAGAAHICLWEKDTYGRDAIRVFKIGEGKDAKRQRMTAAQRQARSRAKKSNIEMNQRMAA